MHKYWARRLGSVFRSILLYALADEEMAVKENGQTTLDDLSEIDWDNPDALWEYYLEDVDFDDKTVLDPFMGGGTSIVESLRLGCNAIGSDLNPVSWFIVKKEVEPVDTDDLREAYDRIDEVAGQEIRDYYRTTCPSCQDEADAMYYFWVKELECLNCGHDVPLFKNHYLADSRSSKDDYKNVTCPECWSIQRADDTDEEVTCDNDECEAEFVPSESGNVSGKYYTCPECQQKREVVDGTEQFGKPDATLYAIEYYCESCDEKGYRSPTDFDRELYSEASEQLEREWDDLPIPTQERYNGASDRARNHGYETYDQMFNDRQLLCLGRLLNEIDNIENQNVKEFLLLAFSSATEFNNMLCEYNRTANKLEGVYKRHTILSRHQPIENNIWGTAYGRGTFSGEFDKMVAGKEFCANPYEKYVEDDETKQEDGIGKIEGYITDDPDKIGEPVDGADGATYNTHLRCGTSEYLPVEDGSVDAVITDPPYFDNVMYAEGADFYYVWLKQVLEDEYDHFTAELTPKAGEIVSDPSKNVENYRDEDHFITGLTNVFSESHDKLRDDGVMVFTFHHKETEGWHSVLRSVLDAGFYVTSIYPIRAEMRGSTHIHGKANIEYDMIVVCRKRAEDPDEAIWQSLEDEIYFRAEDEITRLDESGSRVSHGDIFAITMGKCLEVFSKHYPNVTHDGEPMSVVDAVDAIKDIVDEQLLEERVQTLGDEMDLPSAVYLTYVLGRGEEIPYNTLNKELRQRGVDVDELITDGLVVREGDQIAIRSFEDRADEIESKHDPLAVDKAHYLRHLYETDRLSKEFGSWADEEAIVALRRLAQIENEDAYEDIADFVEERLNEQAEIDEFL